MAAVGLLDACGPLILFAAFGLLDVGDPPPLNVWLWTLILPSTVCRLMDVGDPLFLPSVSEFAWLENGASAFWFYSGVRPHWKMGPERPTRQRDNAEKSLRGECFSGFVRAYWLVCW